MDELKMVSTDELLEELGRRGVAAVFAQLRRGEDADFVKYNYTGSVYTCLGLQAGLQEYLMSLLMAAEDIDMGDDDFERKWAAGGSQR